MHCIYERRRKKERYLQIQIQKNTDLHVIATARNVAVLQDLAAKGMSALSLDVTKTESINACYAEVAKLTGGRGLDILVNNA